MKRFLIATAIVLALSVAVLAVGSSRVSENETNVAQVINISRGSAEKLDGLKVKSSITYDQKLLWETTRNIKTKGSSTEFSFNSSKINRAYNFTEYPPYQIYARLCDSNDESDRMTKELKNGESEMIKLKDYFTYYDLYLGESYIYTSEPYDICRATSSNFCPSESKFTLLKIPAEEEDIAEMYCSQSEVDRFVNTNFLNIAHSFESYVVPCDGGLLVSVGFAPKYEPEKSWAPSGFGIWMIPEKTATKTTELNHLYEEKIYPSEEAKLVYPLDIENQYVLAMKWSWNKESLFLVTAENGEAVLRILDGKTFSLQGQLDLGPIGINKDDYGYFSESTLWKEITVEKVLFDIVKVRTDENFTAIAIGNSLTVLDKNHKKDFDCQFVNLCSYHIDGDQTFFWQDDETVSKKYKEAALCYSPGNYEYYGDFSEKSMEYKDHMLAIAWYDGSDALHVHVYGKDGLIYGERSESSLWGQQGQNGRRGYHYFYLPENRPEINWE